MNQQISRHGLERALCDIRKDVAYLHKDLAHALSDDLRRISIIMWLLVSIVLSEVLTLPMLQSLGYSGLMVAIYRVVEGTIIRHRALKLLKEPLAPEFDTAVDLDR